MSFVWALAIVVSALVGSASVTARADGGQPAEPGTAPTTPASITLAQIGVADELDRAEDAMTGAPAEDFGDDGRIYGEDDLNDPFENVNRFFFKVNNTLDRYFLRPIAIAYKTVIPRPFRLMTRNIINNLAAPVTLANDFLQLEFKRAGVTLGRFAINSTFGFLGAADVASGLGLERHAEDFGQTLGVYGVPEGPYLYLPFIGPAPPRDLVGGVVDVLLDPTTWLGGDIVESDAIGLEWQALGQIRFGLNILDSRSQAIEQLDELERSSIDFYATIRSLYRQSRDGAIRNGRIEFNDLPEIDEFDETFDE
ncbi:MAG: VacJ family lipoprotein [Alphaproteobacteria bacterium]